LLKLVNRKVYRRVSQSVRYITWSCDLDFWLLTSGLQNFSSSYSYHEKYFYQVSTLRNLSFSS